MKLKKEYEQLLTVILDDLRVCLRYTPNRENDLLCFMEQYIKAPRKLRQTMLPSIRACMDGKSYPNPHLAYQQYGEEEIVVLEQLLRGYLADMHGDSNKVLVLENLITALNELQDKCCGQLIDDWRKDHLTQLLVLSAKEQNLLAASAIIDSENRW